jgi:hypothetical protein
MAEMYGYAQDFGYDGGDPHVIYSRDVSDAASFPFEACTSLF